MNDLQETQLHESFPSREVRFFERIESTNDLGLDWLQQGAPAGALIVADAQTDGRGRLGRTWYAPPGSALLFTMVFTVPRELAVRSTMLGALAVAETLREMGVRGVGIKYPNDVQIARRKVCGVLAEAAWTDKVGVALGIGINVRVDFTGTPLELTATSLETVLNRPVDRASLLKSIVARLDFWRARLGTDALPAAWRSYLNMLGEWVEVHTGTEVLRGIAADVGRDGSLILRDRHGTLRSVWAGDLIAPGTDLPPESDRDA
ncbi:MAG: biotin--[acetyl-CoA-carboxylase] ligase [Anaerolineae bacterium]